MTGPTAGPCSPGRATGPRRIGPQRYSVGSRGPGVQDAAKAHLRTRCGKHTERLLRDTASRHNPRTLSRECSICRSIPSIHGTNATHPPSPTRKEGCAASDNDGKSGEVDFLEEARRKSPSSKSWHSEEDTRYLGDSNMKRRSAMIGRIGRINERRSAADHLQCANSPLFPRATG